MNLLLTFWTEDLVTYLRMSLTLTLTPTPLIRPDSERAAFASHCAGWLHTSYLPSSVFFLVGGPRLTNEKDTIMCLPVRYRRLGAKVCHPPHIQCLCCGTSYLFDERPVSSFVRCRWTKEDHDSRSSSDRPSDTLHSCYNVREIMSFRNSPITKLRFSWTTVSLS